MISKKNFVNYISKSNDCAVKNKLYFFPSSIQWWCENLIPYSSHTNGNNMANDNNIYTFDVGGVKILNFLFDIN